MTARKKAKAQAKKEGYHHGDLRRALIDASLALVQEHGMSGLTLREAARRAGVTHAAPYRHFTDRAALVVALADEGFRAMTEALRRAEARESDPVARFRAAGTAYVAFAVKNPAHFRVMFSAEAADKAREPPLVGSAAETFQVLVDAVTACQRTGAVVAGDPTLLAALCWSTAHGVSGLLIENQLTGRGISIRSLPEELFGALYLGLAPRG